MRDNMSRWLIALASIAIISCSSGNKDEMYGVGYTDESYVGTPLNKSAVDGLKLGRLTPNVPYSIKEGADLSEAVQIGLMVCDEQQKKVENS